MRRSISNILTKLVSTKHSTDEKRALSNALGQIQAMSQSFAVIEFTLDGTIVSANENFLSAMGYSLAEIEGQHHRMFVDKATASSREYTEFWQKLGQGTFQAGEFKRVTKDGLPIWLQASYNPILDDSGNPIRVVKYASDITEQKKLSADFKSQLNAINKSQAVIEFNLDGSIVSANQNFLETLGYKLEEVIGRHHSMFMDPSAKSSMEYQQFWKALNRGEYQAGVFRRLGRNGQDVWIRASYNPVLDSEGNPYKVVKFASDITEQTLLNQETDSVQDEATRVLNALAEGDLT